MHRQVGEARFGVAEDILHNPTPFDTGDHMLYPNPHTGNHAVQKAVRQSQGLPSRFFLRLQRLYSWRSIALKACILLEGGSWRVVNVFAVGDFFIMGLARIRLTQILNPFGVFMDEEQVFVGMGLFFPL